MSLQKRDELKKLSTEELIESLGRVCTPIDVNRQQSLEEYLAERLALEQKRIQATTDQTAAKPSKAVERRD